LYRRIQETPTNVAPLLFVDDNDENDAPRHSIRRSLRFRKSDVTSRRKNVTGSTPPPAKSAVKRRRTLFTISSPFSAKNKSAGGHSKVRKMSESNRPKETVIPDEETVPVVFDGLDKQDFEDVVREGLPVIPFFQTPKTGSRNPPQARLNMDTMTVRALATPMASRRLISKRLEDHLVLLPPRTKDFLVEDGYFTLKGPCSGRHCQSCTCKMSPKLLFNDNDSDYVQMDPRTPNL
jgi:hypothetical protein